MPKLKALKPKNRKKLLMAAILAIAVAVIFISLNYLLPSAFPGFNIPAMFGISIPTPDSFMLGNPFSILPDQNAIFLDPLNPFKYLNPFG